MEKKWISRWDEYNIISDMFSTKMRELKNILVVLENIPYNDINPTKEQLLTGKLYCLEYSKNLESIACSVGTNIYSFNKLKLELIKKCMGIMTVKIQNELTEYFSTYEFIHHDKETIKKYIRHFGYFPRWGTQEEIAITDNSEYINSLYKKNVKFGKNRHNKNKLKAKYTRCDEYYEPKCSRCGDGGCPSCEPWLYS